MSSVIWFTKRWVDFIKRYIFPSSCMPRDGYERVHYPGKRIGACFITKTLGRTTSKHGEPGVTTYTKTERRFTGWVTPMNSLGCGNSIFVIARGALRKEPSVMFRCCSPNLKNGGTRFLAYRQREPSTGSHGGQREKTFR